MPALLQRTVSDRRRQAIVSAATAPTCAMRDVIEPSLRLSDCAIRLSADIPASGLRTGDTVLMSLAAEKRQGDHIAIMYRDGTNTVLPFVAYAAITDPSLICIAGVLLGFYRPVGEVAL